MNKLVYILILLLGMAAGCHRSDSLSEELDSIDRLCDTNPRLAISLLDSIDHTNISAKDRHRIDLLKVKSRDKAYVRHTSDSLILDVIDYYSSHRKDGLYPEALYYAARVYSDLGDLPTSLEYFRMALDETTDNNDMLLRSSALSQSGRLLEKLGLYGEGISHIKDAIRLSTVLKDSINLFYDNNLLAHIYLNLHEEDSAISHIEAASEFSSVADDEDRAWLEALRAKCLLREGKVDSALMIVRDRTDGTDSLCRPFSYSVASQVYRKAGIKDSAYMYAHILAFDTDPDVSLCGYQWLFSDSLNRMIPSDSVIKFAKAYRNCVDSTFYNREFEQIKLQNARYNYAFHKRESENAKTNSSRLTHLIILIGILSCVSVAVMLWSLRKKKASLNGALGRIKGLEKSLSAADDSVVSLKGNLSAANRRIYGLDRQLSETQQSMDKMVREINSIKENEAYQACLTEIDRSKRKRDLLDEFHDSGNLKGNESLPPSVTNSEIYTQLTDLAGKQTGIPSSLWNDIYSMVDDVYPSMKQRLEILTCGKMTEADFQTAYLIKLGFSPRASSYLCNISKSSMTSRRSRLCGLIFTKNEPLSSLDELITWI